METRECVIRRLIAMSHWLGDEMRGLAMFGEGNTSAKIDHRSLYVKSTGAELGGITEDQFVEIDTQKILEILNDRALSREDINRRIAEARIADRKLVPSGETLFHAYLLSLPDVNYVGHTHPTALNAVLCSQRWREVVRGRVTPEEAVCCGRAPCLVEYVNTGMALALKVRETALEYIQRHGTRPKAILLQNHGLIALGSTYKEVQCVTAAWEKAAKILAGTFLFGGPNYLSEENVSYTCDLPEIHFREKVIMGK